MKKVRILLRACSRCHGDLFPDIYEEDFACLQCGRRFDTAEVLRQESVESREPSMAEAA